MLWRAALLAASLIMGFAAADAQERPRSDRMTIQEQLQKSPLTLYVARGEADACGRGCNEWIAAEGTFDRNSAARVRKFVSHANRRRLPIFFNSAGGIVAEALAVGSLLRELGMSAGVARTLPEACVPPGDETACKAAKKSADTIRAEWHSFGALCNSACVYALIGSRERSVPPGSRLGVHSTKTICISKSGGRVTELGAQHEFCRNAKAKSVARLQNYVRQMGVDVQLLEVANQVPHSDVRFLTRDEIARFGVDRRDFQESPWMAQPGAIRPTIVKFLSEARGASRTDHRASAIALECHYMGGVFVSYFRPVSEAEIGASVRIRMLMDERSFAFPNTGSISRFDFLDRDSLFDRRQILLPPQVVNAAMSASKIDIEEITQAAEGGPVTRVRHLSTAGLQRIWATIRPRCSGSALLPFTEGPPAAAILRYYGANATSASY